jgi:hypothetical protein
MQFMLKLKPLSLIFDAENDDGTRQYRVTCSLNNGEHVVYTFRADTGDVPGIQSGDAFLSDTLGDPAADKLLRAVMMFDAARQMN